MDISKSQANLANQGLMLIDMSLCHLAEVIQQALSFVCG
jgi:hypothetical protein